MDEQLRNPGINAEKRFDVLVECLQDAYKELIDANFKISTILLAVLAWFVANENPLVMLCELPTLAYFALLFTALGWVLLIYLFGLLYVRAAKLYLALEELLYDKILFGRYRVTKLMFACGVFGHFTMLLGIFTLILVKYVWRHKNTCF